MNEHNFKISLWKRSFRQMSSIKTALWGNTGLLLACVECAFMSYGNSIGALQMSGSGFIIGRYICTQFLQWRMIYIIGDTVLRISHKTNRYINLFRVWSYFPFWGFLFTFPKADVCNEIKIYTYRLWQLHWYNNFISMCGIFHPVNGLLIRYNNAYFLTHLGRETHICVGNLTIIGSDNGLSPGRRQAIILTNAGILSIGPLGINFSGNLIEILTFWFTKMRLKVSSAKWRPFCLGLNVLS